MLEFKLLSFLVGSLGLQAAIASGWLRWQQQTRERYCEQEEEILTPYESKDTYVSTESFQRNGSTQPPKDPRMVGWEFKIVRASRDLFRNPVIFKHLCEEEALAGWILLEKLDDRRVRFKRPIALRDCIQAEALSIDPYRTQFGSSRNWVAIVWAIAFLAATTLPAYLGYMLVSVTLSNSRLIQPATSISPLPSSSRLRSGSPHQGSPSATPSPALKSSY
jgi:hypothetical protein